MPSTFIKILIDPNPIVLIILSFPKLIEIGIPKGV